ncbi:hypothetical protein K9B35_12565 [Sphingomonas sp. R647]|uniref:hypothetical protein n=1 Tax=Sphingomonas sp. R647 TaxID=2875233 RepID=UPI001CD7135C|nr:hypothetical protein [Sphingomonas sp. R647]MCA1198803.1 hypothetical protein [Sphingomonas sp. R647]
MSEIESVNRYRATGQKQFVLTLVGLVLAAVLLQLAFQRVLGANMAIYGALAAASGLWIVQLVRTIVGPRQSRKAMELGRSLRTVRLRATLALIANTVVLTISIQHLFFSE